MTKSVDSFEKLKSVGARGQFGKRTEYGEQMYGERSYGDEEIEDSINEFGVAQFGDTEFGSDDQIAGIYEQRQAREDFLGLGEKETGRPHTILKRNYTPKNPRSVPQQAWRAIHADGVHAWQALTNEQKAKLDEEAAELNMSGFNLSVRRYLNSHK